MDRPVHYVPCPSSPTGSTDLNVSSKRTMGIREVFLVIGAIGTVLFVIFFGLYIHERYSEPAVRLAQCQSELQNQSSRAEARIASLGQRLEAMEKEKGKGHEEGDRLRAQLANANRSVDQMKGLRDACQKKLKSLENNVTIVEEKAKQLKQQLLNKAEALKVAQSQSQQYQREKEAQRKKYEADIQKLMDDLKTKTSKCSRAAALGGPVTAPFPVIFGGLFFFLFL